MDLRLEQMWDAHTIKVSFSMVDAATQKKRCAYEVPQCDVSTALVEFC